MNGNGETFVLFLSSGLVWDLWITKGSETL